MRKKKVSASPNRGSSKSPARSNRTTRTKRKASDNDQEEVGNFIFLFLGYINDMAQWSVSIPKT